MDTISFPVVSPAPAFNALRASAHRLKGQERIRLTFDSGPVALCPATAEPLALSEDQSDDLKNGRPVRYTDPQGRRWWLSPSEPQPFWGRLLHRLVSAEPLAWAVLPFLSGVLTGAALFG